MHWNSFIHEVMPLVPLPAPGGRAEVVELLRRIHIAPSHRRMPHHTWKDALSLVMDLLLGFGERRYFNMAIVWQRATRVNIKGFSAGSYVGLALVHVLRISRVSEHVVSWAQLRVRLSLRCPMIDILSTSSTVYQTNCADGTLASLSWTRLGVNAPLCMGTLTYTNIILERTSIIIPISWACNWKEEFSLCPIS